jgi:D-arabinose 1-dehydrogenase-like Zn-dependent alcohol dehydrogenase
MQALYLKNKQLNYQNNVPIPEPQSGEALVRVRLAGICATDFGIGEGILSL